jgi:hypothetical protein
MGGAASRRPKSSVARPANASTGSGPLPYNQRPASPFGTGASGFSPLSRRQQRQLDEANRTIQNLQNQMAVMQRSAGNTGGLPMSSSMPNLYDGLPIFNQSSINRPVSPLLQHLTGQTGSPYSLYSPGVLRDSDYAALATISGLNPADVALLHREYGNLTHGGMNKIDRVTFRQLLRDSLVEANNESIDRTIENIFVTIDRNRDGFIDFPEFVGAFRDLLKTNATDMNGNFSLAALSNQLNEQTRVNYQSLPMNYISSPSGASQTPLIYNGNSPLVISLDSNSSPYMINNQGQSFASPSNNIQYMPVSMM